MVKPNVEITICLGSSCFSRGNNQNVSVVERLVSAAGSACRMVGQLCQDDCRNGPNIIINGQAFHNMRPTSLDALLKHHLAPGGPKADGRESVP